MKGQNKESRDIVILYSEQENKFAKRIYQHLEILKKTNVCNIWWKENIRAGQEWEKRINEEIENSDILIVLLSPDFIVENICYSEIILKALKDQVEGRQVIIPILIKFCDWQSTPFKNLKIFPDHETSISSLKKRNKTYNKLREIVTIEVILAEYEETIMKGNEFYDNQNWLEAKNNFNLALKNYENGYKPNSVEVQKKIEQCEKELEHNLYETEGDKFFSIGKKDEAKKMYEAAIKIKHTKPLQSKIYSCNREIIANAREFQLKDVNLNSQITITLITCIILIIISSIFLIYKSEGELNKPIKNKLSIFKSENKMGIVNSKNAVIVEPVYDSIFHFKNNYLIKSNVRWGFLDSTGTEVITPQIENKYKLIRMLDLTTRQN